MKKNIYIFGIGGNSKIVTEIAKDNFNILGYLLSDEKYKKDSKSIKSKKIYNEKNIITKYKKLNIVFSIGENYVRYSLIKKYNSYKLSYPNIIHKTAIISNNVNIGYGNLIMPNVVINSNSKIQNFCIINTSSVIEHDTYIGSYSSIAPKAVICGGSKIGEGTFIGANSTIIHNLNIGNWSIIGAGSVVTKNIDNNELHYGNPLKFIKKIKRSYTVL